METFEANSCRAKECYIGKDINIDIFAKTEDKRSIVMLPGSKAEGKRGLGKYRWCRNNDKIEVKYTVSQYIDLC